MSADWQALDPAAEDLFAQLRSLGAAEARVHLSVNVAQGGHAGIPATSLTLRGPLSVHPHADRLTLALGDGQEARLGRRKERGGRPPYWQILVEAKSGEYPSLVVSLTAYPESLSLSVRKLNGA